MGKIYILVGASGSGKTTIANRLRSYDFARLVGSTTRSIRPGEVDGVDYHFITREEFASTDFFEQADYAGNHYGLSRKEADRALRRVMPTIGVMEITGATKMRELLGEENVSLISIMVKPTEAIKRMELRGDSSDDISRRINNAVAIGEFDNWRECDYAILNNNLSASVDQILAIVESEAKQKVAAI